MAKEWAMVGLLVFSEILVGTVGSHREIGLQYTPIRRRSGKRQKTTRLHFVCFGL